MRCWLLCSQSKEQSWIFSKFVWLCSPLFSRSIHATITQKLTRMYALMVFDAIKTANSNLTQLYAMCSMTWVDLVFFPDCWKNYVRWTKERDSISVVIGRRRFFILTASRRWHEASKYSWFGFPFPVKMWFISKQKDIQVGTWVRCYTFRNFWEARVVLTFLEKGRNAPSVCSDSYRLYST